jgi:hypothetical protein
MTLRKPVAKAVEAEALASARRVSALIRASLKDGRHVAVERLGEFRPTRDGGFRFIPELRPSVFLAYVSEDTATVERLYNALERNGFDPWMDRRKLLPGQNWPRGIERAIEKADFFVACLSRRAVTKRSRFQCELRYALGCARRVPFDQIYFVPARLDACTVPMAIKKHLQVIDLFPDLERAAERLAGAIRQELRLRQAA